MALPRLLNKTRAPLCLALWLGFACLTAAADSRYQRSWSAAEGGEELEGSFDEQAHELQNWLRRREAERRDTWGNDVVTPENPALRRAPRYFGTRDYDSQGYRRLNENTRFRLRGGEGWGLGEDAHAGSLRRAGSPAEQGQAEEAEFTDDPIDDARPAHKSKRRHSSHRKRKRR